MDDIDDDDLFKPIHSPIDVDAHAMSDEVIDIMFDKHPLDKKDPCREIFTSTPTEVIPGSQRRMFDSNFKSLLNNADRLKIVKSDLKPVQDPEPVKHPEPEQEEPLDLRIDEKKEEENERKAKSNQVCFMKYNFSATLLWSNLKLVFCKTCIIIL